jgi:hypothetical protein
MSSFFAVARVCRDATMTVVSAQYMPDGSCELVDVCGAATTWSTVVEWADAWLEEWRGGTHGPASKFADEMTDGATDGVVAVLTVLAERAALRDRMNSAGLAQVRWRIFFLTQGTTPRYSPRSNVSPGGTRRSDRLWQACGLAARWVPTSGCGSWRWVLAMTAPKT